MYTYTYIYIYKCIHIDVEMHKVQVEACITRSATQKTPPAHPDDRRRVLGAAGNHAAGQQAIEDQNIVNRPNTSLSGAQPDRKRTSQHGGIDGIHTHASSEPMNSPKSPACSTHALATAHESKWRGPSCPVSPDFGPATKLGARLGIHRVVQQLGTPTNFQDASRPHSPARLLAPSTPRARIWAASSSEDSTAGCVRRH